MSVPTAIPESPHAVAGGRLGEAPKKERRAVHRRRYQIDLSNSEMADAFHTMPRSDSLLTLPL
jgi:hypothetical protein